MVHKFFFVFLYLAIQFVDKPVDCGIHIVFSCIGIYFAAIHTHRCFCLMS